MERELAEVVGVRFREAGKIYYFDPNGQDFKVGEKAVVETTRGLEFGFVVKSNQNVPVSELVMPLKKVLRKATAEDCRQLEDNQLKAREAYDICMKKIKEHQMEMKLVDVEYTLDRSKIIFYFTADGRVDFRELVKDLASVFRTRIELRQIGVRDEAKMIGGLGPCGRPLCCSTFLGEFEPVSIRMAKDQNLSLNPTKISGACGRLMCCLRYEMEAYECAKEEFPDIGDEVLTPSGEGKIVNINIVRKTVQVELKESSRVEGFPIEEVDPGDFK